MSNFIKFLKLWLGNDARSITGVRCSILGIKGAFHLYDLPLLGGYLLGDSAPMHDRVSLLVPLHMLIVNGVAALQVIGGSDSTDRPVITFPQGIVPKLLR